MVFLAFLAFNVVSLVRDLSSIPGPTHAPLSPWVHAFLADFDDERGVLCVGCASSARAFCVCPGGPVWEVRS